MTTAIVEKEVEATDEKPDVQASAEEEAPEASSEDTGKEEPQLEDWELELEAKAAAEAEEEDDDSYLLDEYPSYEEVVKQKENEIAKLKKQQRKTERYLWVQEAAKKFPYAADSFHEFEVKHTGARGKAEFFRKAKRINEKIEKRVKKETADLEAKVDQLAEQKFEQKKKELEKAWGRIPSGPSTTDEGNEQAKANEEIEALIQGGNVSKLAKRIASQKGFSSFFGLKETT